jgi:hypothetical protein
MESKEPCLLIVSFFLKFCDTTTTIIYLVLEPFASNILFYLTLSFVILPTFFLISGFLVVLFLRRISKLPDAALSLPRDLLIIPEQFGVFSLFYAINLKRAKKEPDSSVISMLKGADIANVVLESCPQLILQTLNSGLTGLADGILVASCILRGIHLFYACCRLVQTYDTHARIQSVISMVPASDSAKQTVQAIDITLEDINKLTNYDPACVRLALALLNSLIFFGNVACTGRSDLKFSVDITFSK